MQISHIYPVALGLFNLLGSTNYNASKFGRSFPKAIAHKGNIHGDL